MNFKHNLMGWVLMLALVSPATWSSRGNTPLDEDERLQVLEIANRSMMVGRMRSAQSDLQLLLIERRPGESRGQRSANVYSYDYASDEVIHQVVDVSTMTMRDTHRMRDMQLPLAQVEKQNAISLMFNDSKSNASLRSAFHRATGKNLEAISQIHYKATIFVDPAVADCGRKRCAHILMYTADSVVLDVAPIVSLSDRAVVRGVAP